MRLCGWTFSRQAGSHRIWRSPNGYRHSVQPDGNKAKRYQVSQFLKRFDRPVLDAKVAIYPDKRMFQTALVDEDIQDGFSTVLYMPGHESEDHESWYINMGIVTKAFLDPHQLQNYAH